MANSTQQMVRYTTNHDIVGRNDSLLPFQVFQNHNGVVANFGECLHAGRSVFDERAGS